MVEGINKHFLKMQQNSITKAINLITQDVMLSDNAVLAVAILSQAASELKDAYNLHDKKTEAEIKDLANQS